MLDDEDPKIEYSPLCGTVTREGVSIELQIYWLSDGPNGWTLELVDKGTSTVWDNEFPTDREAYVAFYQALEAEGITGVLDPKPERLN
jgi:hypothetical protein